VSALASKGVAGRGGVAARVTKVGRVAAAVLVLFGACGTGAVVAACEDKLAWLRESGAGGLAKKGELVKT